MNLLERADNEAFERGQDLKTPIPDGIIKIHNLS